MSPIILPDPGNGYTVREFLGEGNWKTVYRATSMHRAQDVAILYFRNETSHAAFTKEVLGNLKAAKEHPFKDYIAEFIALHIDKSGRWYIVEELLARPLDKVAVVNDVTRLVRLARDLCRGLSCLHHAKLVHRDIKLDNCGLDHQDRAKIFDLGLVTSDPQELRGNIFTRSPELFNDKPLLRKLKPAFSSDVWAMGATLYALAFGEYPYVHKSELLERKRINDRHKRKELSKEKSVEEKSKLEERVAKRILKANAYQELQRKVKSKLDGKAGDILCSMLNFNEQCRLSAEEYAKQWEYLANEISGLENHEHIIAGSKRDVVVSLEHISRGRLHVTHKQIERLAQELRDEKRSISKLPSTKETRQNLSEIDNLEKVVQRFKSKQTSAQNIRKRRPAPANRPGVA